MPLTVWSIADAGQDALMARAYGSRLTDLAVDFDWPLDSVISAILQTCLSGPDGVAVSGADVAQWTVAKRRQGLLAVAVATSGPPRHIVADCPDCGEKLDLDVDLREFRLDWRAEDVAFGTARLRLPRPSDLARLGDDPTELAHVLLVGDAPPGDWKAAAEAILGAADPLADLELRATCPDCGGSVAVPLMLETYLVGELAREAIRLMDDIHVMALAYHWNECDIIALPESRRRHYLARIQEAWAA